MFLTESVIYGTPAVDANPSTGWKMLYESEVEWGRLTMGMTRLEHDAIVNEDSSLLQEGLKEFGQKVKRWFQWAGQEFLRYLDKVLDTWVNLQNKIRSWMIDDRTIKEKISKSGGKGISISEKNLAAINVGKEIAAASDRIASELTKIQDNADDYYGSEGSNSDTAMGTGAAMGLRTEKGGASSKVKLFLQKAGVSANVIRVLSKDSNSYNDVPNGLTDASQLKSIVNFAKEGRIRCIKALQSMRNTFAKIINRGIKAADNESEDVKKIKRASSDIREFINKYISLINKATNAAISAMSKLKSQEKLTDEASKGNEYFFD